MADTDKPAEHVGETTARPADAGRAVQGHERNVQRMASVPAAANTVPVDASIAVHHDSSADVVTERAACVSAKDGVDGASNHPSAGEKVGEAVRKRGRPRKNQSEKASCAPATKKSKPAAKRSKTPAAHADSSNDDTGDDDDDHAELTPRMSTAFVPRKLHFANDDPEIVVC